MVKTTFLLDFPDPEGTLQPGGRHDRHSRAGCFDGGSWRGETGADRARGALSAAAQGVRQGWRAQAGAGGGDFEADGDGGSVARHGDRGGGKIDRGARVGKGPAGPDELVGHEAGGRVGHLRRARGRAG